MIIANFKEGESSKKIYDLWQWDYGQILRIQGLDLPSAVEIHFSLKDTGGEATTRIGTTKDGVTDVPIPDSMLQNNGNAVDYSIYAFVYLTDGTSGQTKYKIEIKVKPRPKPEAFDSPEDAELFREAIEAVNNVAESVTAAYEAAQKAAEDIEGDRDLIIQNAVDIEEKLNKNQGTQNAGKMLTINKQGEVTAEKTPLEKAVENYYALRRTGKVYQTKFWKFAENPTSAGEKLLDNAGLVFEPSTDTVEGQDDYLNGQNPLFEWVNVNYVRDSDGSPRPTAIEGDADYKTEGAVDVGTMQMSFWFKWDASNPEYDLITISDTPHPELGLVPWTECVKADGTVLPWCIGSKYISGIASDGKPRSQPGLNPEWKQSHNNMITNYQKKGDGYWGAGAERNTFQIIFNLIKGATKNSQSLYQGCTSYNYQYDAAVQYAGDHTYFPVTNAQAANLIVGSTVSVGYASNNAGALNKDRGQTTVHAYAERVRITKIEDLDGSNKAVYLDTEQGFNTTPVQHTEELSAPIMLSTMPWYSGQTDKVKGRHDGSPVSNTSGKYPYRVQGREYAVGGYILASDVVMDFQPDYGKNVYVAPKGTAHSNADATIRSTYTMLGKIPAKADGTGGDYYVGDIAVDMETGAWYPSVQGSSNSQGYGDMVYAGGAATSGTREFLQGGVLWDASHAGSACLSCGNALGWTHWGYLGCD